MSEERNSIEFSIMTIRSFYMDPTTQDDPNTPDIVESKWDNDLGFGSGNFPQSFMMYDIAALQHMYGAGYTTNAGDTTYLFSPDNGEMWVDGKGQGVPMDAAGNPSNVIFRTIWDGGNTDTYDFSLYGADRELDISLAPGGWCDVDRDSDFQAAHLGGGGFGNDGKHARGQVFNALLYKDITGSLIENAIGGQGDDSIKGNQATNRLEGRDGNDRLEGRDGNDTLMGGTGPDFLVGGTGVDQLYGGSGDGSADQFLFDTFDATGDVSAGQADTIYDFEDVDWILLTSYTFAGDTSTPGNGQFGIWQNGTDWVVTYNSFADDVWHDIVVKGADPHDNVGWWVV